MCGSCCCLKVCDDRRNGFLERFKAGVVGVKIGSVWVRCFRGGGAKEGAEEVEVFRLGLEVCVKEVDVGCGHAKDGLSVFEEVGGEGLRAVVAEIQAVFFGDLGGLVGSRRAFLSVCACGKDGDTCEIGVFRESFF